MSEFWHLYYLVVLSMSCDVFIFLWCRTLSRNVLLQCGSHTLLLQWDPGSVLLKCDLHSILLWCGSHIVCSSCEIHTQCAPAVCSYTVCSCSVFCIQCAPAVCFAYSVPLQCDSHTVCPCSVIHTQCTLVVIHSVVIVFIDCCLYLYLSLCFWKIPHVTNSQNNVTGGPYHHLLNAAQLWLCLADDSLLFQLYAHGCSVDTYWFKWMLIFFFPSCCETF